VVTGAIDDRYQSYTPMMSPYIALSVIAGCLYAMKARPKMKTAEKPHRFAALAQVASTYQDVRFSSSNFAYLTSEVFLSNL
jgi:hypothetical protein